MTAAFAIGSGHTASLASAVIDAALSVLSAQARFLAIYVGDPPQLPELEPQISCTMLQITWPKEGRLLPPTTALVSSSFNSTISSFPGSMILFITLIPKSVSDCGKS